MIQPLDSIPHSDKYIVFCKSFYFKSSLNSHIFDTLGHTVIYILHIHVADLAHRITHMLEHPFRLPARRIFFLFLFCCHSNRLQVRGIVTQQNAPNISTYDEIPRGYGIYASLEPDTHHIYIHHKTLMCFVISELAKQDKKMYNSPSKGRNCATRLYYTLCCNPSSSGSLKNVDHTSSTFCSLSLVVVVPDI